MATIVVRDLPEDTDLDREAMQAISGGARMGGPSASAHAASRGNQITGDAVLRPAPAKQAQRRPAPTLLFT